MSEQSKAIELADWIKNSDRNDIDYGRWGALDQIEEELRHLDAENAALRAQLAQGEPVGKCLTGDELARTSLRNPFIWFGELPKGKLLYTTPQQAQGKVTITTNKNGDCVAVTRTDAEGKVADVLWERSAQQEQTNERDALRNATILKGWADTHSINFVNRSYDQYTTRTVSYDALIDLINSAVLKPTTPNNGLLIEGFEIHALAQRLRRLCRETGFTTNYDKDDDKFVAGSAVTIIGQVLAHLSRNQPAVPEDTKRMDYLSTQFVSVATPLRYGHCPSHITGSPDIEETSWNIRSAIDRAMPAATKDSE